MPLDKDFDLFDEIENEEVPGLDTELKEESKPDLITDEDTVTVEEAVTEETNEESIKENEDEVVEDNEDKEAPAIEPIKKIKTTGETFNRISDFIVNPVADDEWERFKNDTLIKMSGIQIKENIPPNVILHVAADLDSMYSSIYDKYMETKTGLENLTNKEDGILAVIKATNAKGSNETERKANGVAAAEKYKIDKTTVNLFHLIAETRSRLNFLQGIIDQVRFKKDLLVTASAAIKVLNK
jgi:hypothetical protein|nr:MAG TPA: hypothetical protein [Caudoviricetes sp.]